MLWAPVVMTPRHNPLLLALSRHIGLGLVAALCVSCVPDPNQLEGRPCPCAEGFVCVDAICVEGVAPPDAGSDAGDPLDAGMDAGMDAGDPLDAGMDGDVPRDANPPDAGVPGPPSVPTTCWTRTPPCEWGEPGSFQFIEGDPGVLADLGITSNPTFSPDGCELYYSVGGVMHVGRRTAAGSSFVPAGPVEGIDQDASSNSKATITPDQLQLFFTSNRTSTTFQTIHRATRDAPDAPWGGVEEMSALSIEGANNWDGMLAPHGLRYYWAPNQDDSQSLYVGERAALDQPFVRVRPVPGLVTTGAQAEPAISADGRVLVFILDDGEVGGGDREIVYATREDWQAEFGAVIRVPGALLATAGETESTLSPDACEVIVRKGGTFLYLTYVAP